MLSDLGNTLWRWYFEVSDGLRRARDGAAEPIPPSEWLAWKSLTRNIVYPEEYAILRAMDTAYCDELGKELTAFHERQREAAEQENKR